MPERAHGGLHAGDAGIGRQVVSSVHRGVSRDLRRRPRRGERRRQRHGQPERRRAGRDLRGFAGAGDAAVAERQRIRRDQRRRPRIRPRPRAHPRFQSLEGGVAVDGHRRVAERGDRHRRGIQISLGRDDDGRNRVAAQHPLDDAVAHRQRLRGQFPVARGRDGVEFRAGPRQRHHAQVAGDRIQPRDPRRRGGGTLAIAQVQVIAGTPRIAQPGAALHRAGALGADAVAIAHAVGDVEELGVDGHARRRPQRRPGFPRQLRLQRPEQCVQAAAGRHFRRQRLAGQDQLRPARRFAGLPRHQRHLGRQRPEQRHRHGCGGLIGPGSIPIAGTIPAARARPAVFPRPGGIPVAAIGGPPGFPGGVVKRRSHRHEHARLREELLDVVPRPAVGVDEHRVHAGAIDAQPRWRIVRERNGQRHRARLPGRQVDA
ncbi:MAG: hypothetical protein Q4G35_14105, partial [Propionibacteriaceae bacterium]|nr:hypothetical protein [Propionibacteriaceae bacterium]